MNKLAIVSTVFVCAICLIVSADTVEKFIETDPRYMDTKPLKRNARNTFKNLLERTYFTNRTGCVKNGGYCNNGEKCCAACFECECNTQWSPGCTCTNDTCKTGK